MSTKLSVVTLAIFALKFSYDARNVKDHITQGLTEQKKVNKQWVGLFKKLPVGILITKGSDVLHNNKKMEEIAGMSNIKVNRLMNHPINSPINYRTSMISIKLYLYKSKAGLKTLQIQNLWWEVTKFTKQMEAVVEIQLPKI